LPKDCNVTIRILFVVDDFSEGGAAVVIDNLLKELPQKEFTPFIYCLDAIGKLGEEYRKKGVTVICANRVGGFDKSLLKKIKGCIKKNKIDVIHAQQYTAYFYSLLASLPVYPRPKMLFTEHGRHFPEIYKWKRALANQVLHHFTHCIVAVSEAVKESLVKYEKLPAKKIRIILNGIKIPDKVSHQKRKNIGLSEDDLVVGTVSRLVEAKNHQMLIRCFSEVVSKVPNAKLVIVGDGEYKSELEKMVFSHKLQDSVIFTGMRSNAKDLMPLFDVLSLVSFYEGTSMTLLEGMASEVPLVASDVPGNTFLVNDGVNGFLVPIDEDKMLAERLVKLLLDEKLRKKMGKAGKKNLKKRFDRRRMAKEYKTIYKKLTGYTRA